MTALDNGCTTLRDQNQLDWMIAGSPAPCIDKQVVNLSPDSKYLVRVDPEKLARFATEKKQMFFEQLNKMQDLLDVTPPPPHVRLHL